MSPRRESRTLKLEPADPFDLIRWLARTQSDPRKAVAELVQNSIDAGARHIRIERHRMRGVSALVIRDDGQGVLPLLGREEALRNLATNIGHSHKRGLSASERHAQVIAGQYGVGLLGFWAVGHRMDIRSRVAGSDLHVLRLVEDRPTAEIVRQPLPLDAPPTFTEIVVLDLHDPALRPLGGRRLADYLAAELRGQILSSGAVIEVHDRMARGLAQKHFPVVPRRFEGERLRLPAELPVEGHVPARVELYLARGVERATIQVSCAGTLVADDLAELPALGFTAAPWVGCDVTGVLDFPGFTVPPGTRRGVVPNAAAAAFASALQTIEDPLSAELKRLARERRAATDRQVVQELRRALRGLREHLPHYDLPAVEGGNEGDVAEARGAPVAPVVLEEDAAAHELVQPELFAPGPLASLDVVPERVQLSAGAERRVEARALDADRRPIRTGIEYVWSIEAPGFGLRGDGRRPAVTAAGEARVGAEALLHVRAVQGERHLTAVATVVVVGPREPRQDGGLGIPEPELVDEPNGSWRSRYDGQRWQVNASHEDYISLGSDSRARLRYLVALLGKEIVARSYATPGGGELLEHLVAILAHAERNLRREH